MHNFNMTTTKDTKDTKDNDVNSILDDNFKSIEILNQIISSSSSTKNATTTNNTCSLLYETFITEKPTLQIEFEKMLRKFIDDNKNDKNIKCILDLFSIIPANIINAKFVTTVLNHYKNYPNKPLCCLVSFYYCSNGNDCEHKIEFYNHCLKYSKTCTVDCLTYLADIFFNGWAQQKIDMTRALELYLVISKQKNDKDPSVLNLIGCVYTGTKYNANLDNLQISKNMCLGIKYYSMAIELGDHRAEWNLAQIYLEYHNSKTIDLGGGRTNIKTIQEIIKLIQDSIDKCKLPVCNVCSDSYENLGYIAHHYKVKDEKFENNYLFLTKYYYEDRKSVV